MSNWTANDIPDQTGKIAIVTGANTGIGWETARVLAEKGAQVVLGCRSKEKGATALEKIWTKNPDAKVELILLDLSDLSSIRHFAKEFQSRYDQLHLLINNAGVMSLPDRRETVDGFEMQFGVNHLGHFALTGLLIDSIRRTSGARVVTVSSLAHDMGNIEFDNLNSEQAYSAWDAYASSKLANLLFTYELQRHFESNRSDAIATAAHPGWTVTDLQRHDRTMQEQTLTVGQKTEIGALPTLYAATVPDLQGGTYYGPNGRREMRGYPKQTESNARSHDEAVAKELWKASEELTGIAYQGI